MAYSRTLNVEDGVDDATADNYNFLRAEVKASLLKLNLHPFSKAFTYAGGTTGSLLSQVVFTDDDTDTGNKVTATQTYHYDSSDQIDSITTVFSTLGVTATETITYTNGIITATALALS